MDDAEVMQRLYLGLQSRELPETVARTLAEHSGIAADPEVARLLAKRARARWLRSSMPETWFEPVDLRKKIAVAQALFGDRTAGSNDPRAVISPVEKDPRRIALFIAFLSEQICKSPAKAPFHARLNREGRAAQGMELGNHAYNKRYRLLNRMSEHLASYRRERRFFGYRLAGKAGLVHEVDFEEFASHPWSAAFAAYFAARRRRRSVFTVFSQDRPFDDLAELLLDRCEAHGANWLLVARVYPEPRVLERLTEAERGQLIGHWLLLLRDLSEDLARAWKASDINLDTMIVKRGNDSSTWNIAAQAWNAARTSWLALLATMGEGHITERFLPGKVLRLMAGDVAAWHRLTGGSVHPDTRVWRELPFPWEVMRGQAPCTRETVERACRRAGIDPVKSGWLEAQVSRKAVRYEPTPELVHGVAVATPELAGLLRKLGYYSGKP